MRTTLVETVYCTTVVGVELVTVKDVLNLNLTMYHCIRKTILSLKDYIIENTRILCY